jgi:hypothetical protein
MTSLAKLLALLAPLALALPGCGTDAPTGGTGDCTGDKCDDLDKPDSEVTPSKCDGIMHDLSGRGNSRVAGRLNDPVAQMLWHNDDTCPTGYQDIMAKLREVDTDGCEEERDGIKTRVVTETAQLADMPTSYRLVTTRQCADRAEHEILFSLFGVRAGATSLPTGVEIIAFDKEEGVFNYYETDGEEINFFGNSRDMKQGAQGNTRRCAGCHTGGGLVMKELDTPWLHWEGHTDTPGAAELVTANADLGTKASGSNMESLTNAGNRAWNAARVDFLLERGSARDLLEPLFCTVEVNIDNGADFPDSKMSSIKADSILDPKLKSFGSISIENDDYIAQMATNGQQVPGFTEPDTIFAYAFIERAKADINFIDMLVDRDIITEEFMKDVLAVDLTRPIFSDDRCGLLQAIPQDFEAGDGKSAELAEAVKSALAMEQPGSPGGDLRANLNVEGGHQAVVDTFFSSCEGLDSATLVERAMEIQSLHRIKAQRLPVFEFANTLPADNLTVNDDSRLDPTNCEIVTSYVSTPTVAAAE